MLPAPTNFDADYEPLSRDTLCVTLWWEEDPRASYYRLYRDTDVKEIWPPYNYKTVDGKKFIVYRDIEAWYAGQALDLFYWVAAVENIAPSGSPPIYEEGQLSDAVTNLHPFGLRVIEEARAMIGDDLRMFNDKLKKVSEQISIYNYKIAMDQALSTINATPTFTSYTYGNIPDEFKSLLTMGTLINVLPKLILLEKAKAMSFEDQGQSWTPPDLSAAFESRLKDLKEDFNNLRKEIKHNIRPIPRAVGSLKALFISPQMLKWRHVPTGRNFF